MKNSNFSKRALITGATGYIGSRLVHRLVQNGWDVHLIIRHSSDLRVLNEVIEKIKIHTVGNDIDSMVAAMSAASPNIVFHLASLFLSEHQTSQIADLINSNILYSTNLIESMRLCGVKRMVNTGTCWQYFNDDSYRPVNLYAATKQAFQDIVEYYVDAENFNVINLALFDTYGPSDPRRKLIPILWDAVLNEEEILLSPGNQLIDLVHVDDVVSAYLISAQLLMDFHVGMKTYGVSSYEPLTLREIITTFEMINRVSLHVTFGGRPYRCREVMRPWSTFDNLPGWGPKIKFEQGIVGTRPVQTKNIV